MDYSTVLIRLEHDEQIEPVAFFCQEVVSAWQTLEHYLIYVDKSTFFECVDSVREMMDIDIITEGDIVVEFAKIYLCKDKHSLLLAKKIIDTYSNNVVDDWKLFCEHYAEEHDVDYEQVYYME